MTLKIIKANYLDSTHEKDIIKLLNSYALDPMGGGKPLSSVVKKDLVKELSNLTYAFSLIGYIDDTPVSLINYFEAFSTFSCKPLINIHDLVVLKKYRGKGISQKMLEKVEDIAKSKGCCKITLEVLSNNNVAKSSYKKFGFSDYELDPMAGSALFWQKKL